MVKEGHRRHKAIKEVGVAPKGFLQHSWILKDLD